MQKDFFKKGMVLGIIILFVGAGVAPSISSESWQTKTTYGETPRASSVNVGTIIVDDEGDGNYTCIQDAIDNAHDEDIIEVYSGTYIENVVIDKQLTIAGIAEELGSGDDIGKPIIDGGGKGDVVSLTSSYVKFSGFKVTNCGDKDINACIEINSDGNLITNNSMPSSSAYGISIAKSTRNTISYNDIANNRFGGIFITQYSPNNKFVNNCFSNNGILIYPWEGTPFYGNTLLIENNTVNGKPLYFFKNMGNGTVPLDAGQVILANCTNFEIKNLNLSNTDMGILLWSSSNNYVTKNELYSNSQEGISLIQSSNNEISRNNISENWAGITILFNSSSNNIHENNITSNGGTLYLKYVLWQAGIVLNFDSTDNLIYANNIIDNGYLFNVWDHCGGNHWDNGTHGNYYSDNWYGIDDNEDGISDRPYYIVNPSSVTTVYKDNFPLMFPTWLGDKPEGIPPTLDVLIPVENHLHIDNQEPSFSTPITIIFALPTMGPIELKARASDSSGIGGVLAFIDEIDYTKIYGNFIKLDCVATGSDLYKGKLTKPLFGKHTLMFVAFDKWGNTNVSAPMDVFFIYLPRPTMID